MARFSLRTRVFLSLGIVALLLLGGAWYAKRSNGVSDDFSEARLQGAVISEKIVDLSNQSTDNVKKINELDKESHYDEALALTRDVVKRSQEIRDLAVQLSEELGKMTRSLSTVKSVEAQQAALEGISSRLALISRLINYSGYLSQLLESLGAHFEKSAAPRASVSSLVEEINAEVRAINNFNAQAKDSMNRFDRLTQ